MTDQDRKDFLTSAHGWMLEDPAWMRWLRAMGHPATDNWPEPMTLLECEQLVWRRMGDNGAGERWKRAVSLLRAHLENSE